MELLSKIYDQDELFYWCNCLGEINMPGENGHFIIHKPEELPPKCAELYEKCQKEVGPCHRYVVTFRGRPGMLLTALHDESYYCDAVDIEDKPTSADDVLVHKCVMDLAALLVQRRCESMTTDFRLENCCVPIFGENTDPAGHELCLFIPAEVALRDIDRIQDVFLEYCWQHEDEAYLRNLTIGFTR